MSPLWARTMHVLYARDLLDPRSPSRETGATVTTAMLPQGTEAS